MEFLTLLMALGLVQLWGSGGPLQQDAWFEKLTRYASQQETMPALRLLLVVGLPCMVVLLALMLVDSLLLGMVSLVIYIAVLLFSFGRGEFSENLLRYLLHWNRGELDRAGVCAREMAGTCAAEVDRVGEESGESEILAVQISLHESVRSALVYGSFERWFTVVFWFMFLGPAAALAYRLSFRAGGSEALEAQERELAQRISYYLQWLPARLLALAFALTGNFVGGFNRSWQSLWQAQSNVKLVEDAALAAINGEQGVPCYPDNHENMTVFGREQLLALQALIQRSSICWIIVIALIEMFF